MEKEFLAKISVILNFSYLVSQISAKIQCSNISPLGPLLLGVKGGGVLRILVVRTEFT